MASPPPSAPDNTGTPCPHCGEPHPTTYTHCPNTGKALTAGPALVGRVIAGRYRIIGLLGEGGMGAVYVAEHTLLGRKVAIKRLHPQLASDEKAVQRFQREARAAAATGHEHIVETLDLGFAEDGAPYLVMEYLRGQSLAALLRKEHRLDPRRACDVVGQVLAGLDAVHRQQIVHRDLKPDNVFLTRRAGVPGDWVKILDFGISKMRREDGEGFELTRTGVMMGTPFYMSPEQARGMKNLDHRVDLYAVGVILYECITGRVPFEGENYHALLQSILRVEPPRPSSLRPDLDPALELVMLRAIAKDPRVRFDSAGAMLEALLPFGAQRPTSESRENGEGPSLAFSTMLQPAAPFSSSGAEDRGPGLRETSDESAVGVSPGDVRTSFRSPSAARPSFDFARAAHLRGSTPTPSRGAGSPPGLVPSGPRYYFAASDDWDESRARVAAEGGAGLRATPPGREPAAGFTLREPGGGGVSSASGREPSGAFGRLSSDRLPHAASREAQRPLSTVEPEPGGGTPPEPRPFTTSSRASTPNGEPAVKGSLVIATLEHLEVLYGQAQVALIRAQLDSEAEARISGVLLPMAWLPIALLEQLVRAAERVLGANDGATAIAIGRAIADRELPTTHRLFMQTASPAAACERVPHFFRLYHSRGEAKVQPTPGGGVRIELDAGVPESLSYACVLAGFWQRMLELTGARDARAVVVSCRGRGDDRTAIALRWR